MRIDDVNCSVCGWQGDTGERIPRKCPECGADNPAYYLEKTFLPSKGSD